MIRKNKIAVISGRYIFHNPYRELVLIDKLRKKNFDVSLFLPSVSHYPKGYSKNITNDKIFKEYNPIIFNNDFDLIKKVKKSNLLLVGSDFKYSRFIILLRLLGKKVVSYDSAGGMDHKNNFANISCVKSEFYKKFMSRLGKIKIDQKTIRVTGSILFEDMRLPKLSKSKFKEKYSVNDKTIVFYPKSIFTFRKKLNTWLKRNKKSIQSVDAHHVYLNEQVCKIIKNMGHTLLVKLHPGLYNSEFVKEELLFWKNLGANIIEPLDTFNMLSYVDLGISLKSQSSLDVNYFRKPFIYLEEGNALPPILDHISDCMLDLGPSDSWGKADPIKFHAMPSWVGSLANLRNLNLKINEALNNDFNKSHYEKYIEHFWFSDDSKASDRIIEQVNILIERDV